VKVAGIGSVTNVGDVPEGHAALVSAGIPLPGFEVVVVDPETCTRSAPTQVGELWVRGQSVAAGYWENEEATEATFRARIRRSAEDDAVCEEGYWLRSGDQGFLHEGHVYITSRLKDVIVLRGKNLYPDDIETVIEKSHDLIRLGRTIVTSITEIDKGVALASKKVAKRAQLIQALQTAKMEDSNLITAFIELRPAEERKRYAKENYEGSDSLERMYGAICNEVRKSILRAVRVHVRLIIFIEPGTIPKTSSGKKRRAKTRQLLISGKVKPIYISAL